MVVVHRRTAAIAAGNDGRAAAVPSTVLASQLEQMQWPEETEAHRFVVVGDDHATLHAAGFYGAAVEPC